MGELKSIRNQIVDYLRSANLWMIYVMLFLDVLFCLSLCTPRKTQIKWTEAETLSDQRDE